MNRLSFVNAMLGIAALGRAARQLAAAESENHLVSVTNPRATSGDPVEPNWAERLSLTVGQEKADLVGSNEKVIQAAVDSVARFGGGTVKILPGTYSFRNAVYLQNNVRILGSGPETVIIKEPSSIAKLADDSDWFDQEITFVEANGFKLGDGICIRVKDPGQRGAQGIKRTLVARNGNRFKLTARCGKTSSCRANRVESLFPLFSGEYISDVRVENIALDGNKANNGNLDGNYAGCSRHPAQCYRAQL
jgi:hypothetical protein